MDRDSDWKRVAAIIIAARDAATTHHALCGAVDIANTEGFLLALIGTAFEQVEAFVERWFASEREQFLPSLQSHREKIDGAWASSLNQMKSAVRSRHGQGSAHGHVADLLTVLLTAKAFVETWMADRDAHYAARIERSLHHLQRLLVADPDAKKRWLTAFGKGETACERLGATHLLWHGIWAFKASAAGERTDLVLGYEVDAAMVEQTDSFLALTEWKVVKKANQFSKETQQGKLQASRYGQGTLGAVELHRTRFIIIVTEKGMKMPTDDTQGDLQFAYRNIAIAPNPLSKSKV